VCPPALIRRESASLALYIKWTKPGRLRAPKVNPAINGGGKNSPTQLPSGYRTAFYRGASTEPETDRGIGDTSLRTEKKVGNEESGLRRVEMLYRKQSSYEKAEKGFFKRKMWECNGYLNEHPPGNKLQNWFPRLGNMAGWKKGLENKSLPPLPQNTYSRRRS